ncbi:putative ferric-chelate reductase 1 [Watersipora subatra]|uniref:putative ferric-chelate reductase 1 n=1 Tax=Watersipora subatra TaxID=2589382 RepID=UPI00355B1D50
MAVHTTLLVLLACVCPYVQGNAAGANIAACADSAFAPQHGGNAAQVSGIPYTITLSTTTYSAGSSITVTLAGDDLKGFLVAALPEDDPTAAPVGSFAAVAENSEELSKAACTGGATHTLAFHNSNPTKNQIELTWTAPNTGNGNLTFYSTFVKDFATFWVKEPSAVVMFDGNNGNSAMNLFGHVTLIFGVLLAQRVVW